MLVKKLVKILAVLMLAASCAFAQQPYTSNTNVLIGNAKYVNGVAPGYWPTKGSGLTLNVSAGTANCGSGVVVQYAGGTLTVTNNTTTNIYLNAASSCAPTASTGGFGSNIPIAIITAASGVITAVVDVRTMMNVPGSGGGGSNTLGNGTTVIDASTMSGADWSVKVNAAAAALPSNGGIIDARGLTGAQAASVNVPLSSAAKPIVLIAGVMTLTRGTGIQISLGTGGVLIGQGGTSTTITGTDTAAAIAGIFAGSAPAYVEITGVNISNNGIGPCVDLLRSSAGILYSKVHNNVFNCTTGVLYTGYYNEIFHNNFNASLGSRFWAGTLGDSNGSGTPNSNHVYDNIYNGGGGGTGDVIRNGYSDRFDGAQDYEGTNLAVYSNAQAIQLQFGGDVENVFCNSRTGWVASTTYGLGAVIFDSNSNCEIDVTAYASGYSTTSGSGSHPTWPTTAGNTVTDGGVTWMMYPAGSESPFVLLDPSAQTNSVTGGIGQNPFVEDLNYVVNGSTNNIIDLQSASQWGTGGTAPYQRNAGPYGYGFISGSTITQPGLGQVIGTFNLQQFNPGSPSSILNGASLDIPIIGNECSTFTYCGHLNLRLGQLFAVAGMSTQGPLSLVGLPTPAAPTLTITGTSGSATCSYYVVAHVNGGVTLPSSVATTTSCPNTLGSGNYVNVKPPTNIGGSIDLWTNVTWDVLKTDTAHSIYTNTRITNGTAVKDQGSSLTPVSSYSAPTRNSTGDITISANIPTDGTTILCVDPSNVISIGCSAGPGGGVSSVGLVLPNFFAVSGSPVISSGSLTGGYASGLTSNENQVLNVDATGHAGLRALTFAMMPPLASSFSTLTWASSGTMTWATAGATPLNISISAIHNTTSTLAVTGLVGGGYYTVFIQQDATGGGTTTINLGSGCSWMVSASTDYSPTSSVAVTPTALDGDVLTFVYNAATTTCYAAYH